MEVNRSTEYADAPAACRGGDFGADSCAQRRLWPLGNTMLCTYHVQMRNLRYRRFAGKICDPIRDRHWSSLFLKGCIPCNGPTLEQLMKNCSMSKNCRRLSLWERLYTAVREECEGEGATETYGKLTTVPLHWRERIQEWNWIQEEGRDGGKDFLRVGFHFSLPYSDLLGD